MLVIGLLILVTARRHIRASLVAQKKKNLPAVQKTWVGSLVRKIPWRREWQPTLVFWKVPWTGEPGQQRTESQRIGHN